MTIVVVDGSGNRRHIIVSRQTTFLELIRTVSGGRYAITGGEKMLGPENYNSTLEELNINPGSDIEVVQKFDGGNNLG